MTPLYRLEEKKARAAEHNKKTPRTTLQETQKGSSHTKTQGKQLFTQFLPFTPDFHTLYYTNDYLNTAMQPTGSVALAAVWWECGRGARHDK